MKANWSVCDFLMVFKVIVGIVIIIAGIYTKSWIGVIGLWPLIEAAIAIFGQGKESC